MEISKRHILYLRRIFFTAELDTLKNCQPGDKLYAKDTEYFSLANKIQMEIKSLTNKVKQNDIDYFNKQLIILKNQQKQFGNSEIKDISTSKLKNCDILSIRKELLNIEIYALKRKLEVNNFYHLIYEKYKTLFIEIFSPENKTDIKKIKDNYIDKILEEHNKDKKSFQEKIHHLEDLKKSYEAIIDELNHKLINCSGDNNDNNELLHSFSSLVKLSNEKILSLEEEIQKYEIIILKIKENNEKIKNNGSEIDIDDIEEKKMTHEFFEDITNLTKKINLLESEKITLQQQISEKNKIINTLKASDYKKSYESAISKLKMINHSYQELEEMYINLLKRNQKPSIKQAG